MLHLAGVDIFTLRNYLQHQQYLEGLVSVPTKRGDHKGGRLHPMNMMFLRGVHVIQAWIIRIFLKIVQIWKTL